MDEAPLPTSLDDLAQAPLHRGAVDFVVDGQVAGWAVHAAERTALLDLSLTLDGNPLGTARTGRPRLDIARALGAPVRAGFLFRLADVAPGHIPALLDALHRALDGGAPPLLRVATAAGPLPILGPNITWTPREWRLWADVLRDRQVALAARALPSRRDAFLAAPPAPAPPASPVRAVAFHGWAPRDWPAHAATPGAALPGELGFTDPRLEDTHRAQAALAAEHGIAAFCYRAEWDAGVEAGWEAIRRHAALDLDLGFCPLWARGADPSPAHGVAGDRDVIHAFLPLLAHRRALRVDGLPLLVVGQPGALHDPAATLDSWRDAARAAGLPGLHVAMLEGEGAADPLAIGADSAVEWPFPDAAPRPWEELAALALRRPRPAHALFRTVLAGGVPEALAGWAAAAAARLCAEEAPDRRLLFLHAWDDWARGAALEPSRAGGRAALRALRDALRGDPPPPLARALAEVARLLALHGAALSPPAAFIPAPPELAAPLPEDGVFAVESVNGRANGFRDQTLAAGTGLSVTGFFVLAGLRPSPEWPAFLLLRPLEPGGTPFAAAAEGRESRPDVGLLTEAGPDGFDFHGLRCLADTRRVAPGSYRLSLALRRPEGGWGALDSGVNIHVG